MYGRLARLSSRRYGPLVGVKANGEARMRRRLVRACLAGAFVYGIAIVLSVFWG